MSLGRFKLRPNCLIYSVWYLCYSPTHHLRFLRWPLVTENMELCCACLMSMELSQSRDLWSRRR